MQYMYWFNIILFFVYSGIHITLRGRPLEVPEIEEQSSSEKKEIL